MNESYLLAWLDTITTINELGETYNYLVATEAIEASSEPSYAALWLGRDMFLNVQLDLIRDLLWHDMRGKTCITREGKQ